MFCSGTIRSDRVGMSNDYMTEDCSGVTGRAILGT
jgi:hypothetical protein